VKFKGVITKTNGQTKKPNSNKQKKPEKIPQTSARQNPGTIILKLPIFK